MPEVPRRPGGDQHIPRPPVWSEDHRAPWPLGSAPSVAELAEAIRTHPAPPDPPAGARLSAVLALLHDGPSGCEVLLTRRSMEMRNHRGEISFPGGRVDPGETPEEAALREADEEVGLDRSAVELVGELDHITTMVSRSYIVPVVGTIDHRPDLRPRTMEVDRVLWLPIAELTRPGTYRSERWGSVPLDRDLHFFELDDETVWGVTAHMLVELLTATL